MKKMNRRIRVCLEWIRFENIGFDKEIWNNYFSGSCGKHKTSETFMEIKNISIMQRLRSYLILIPEICS